MRFKEDGPSIPDELLLARDEGRVVFFCGAGVSLAKAGLPDFFGLTEKVIESLGVVEDSPVRKVLEEVKIIHEKTGVSGLISADSLFGLLEKEFSKSVIDRAVSQTLKLVEPNLAAHQIIIDLATTSTGLTHLVTTNFDRLFNQTNIDLNTWLPPKLPNLLQEKDFDGIVYLHGRVSEDFDQAEGDGFVLSSSEFGKAYLAEAWATKFFKEVLEKYIVVFIGYGADDPPVKYLLEGLNRTRGALQKMYAFQEGDLETARTKWEHRGVNAIAYDPKDKHKALWDSLHAWAERARDVEGWYENIIRMACKGPRKLKPYERGMVAHVVSSEEGSRRFLDFAQVPPAEWLLVFDKYCRYHKPVEKGFYTDEKIDPFSFYCLDSDLLLNKGNASIRKEASQNELATFDEDDNSVREESLLKAWDVFDSMENDKVEQVSNRFTYISDNDLSRMLRPCPRLRYLSEWIGKIIQDPVTLWWVNCQENLHPFVKQQIESNLNELNSAAVDKEIIKGWNLLFKIKELKVIPHNSEWYTLKDSIDKYGWDLLHAEKYLQCLMPRLKSINPLYDYFFPTTENFKNINSIINPSIHFPNPSIGSDIDIPDEWLEYILIGLRRHLMDAFNFALHFDVFLDEIDLSLKSHDLAREAHCNSNLVSGLLFRIAKIFIKVIEVDEEAAKKEYASWEFYKCKYFTRLRVWAARYSSVAPIESVEKVFIEELTQDLFFGNDFANDSLLSLIARWDEMSILAKSKIEDKIIQGPAKYEWEEDGRYHARHAWHVLSRLHFLQQNDCQLICDLDFITAKFKKHISRWDASKAKEIIENTSFRVRRVSQDSDCSLLEGLPASKVIEAAGKVRGRIEESSLVDAEPFQGFSEKYPVRAFTCLNLAAKNNKYPEWAWRIFLTSRLRKEDQPRFVMLIAERLCRYPDEAISPIMWVISSWFYESAKKLFNQSAQSFYKLYDKLYMLGVGDPELFKSGVISSTKISWVGVAINTPVANLAFSMLNDPRLDQDKNSIPSDWLKRTNNLLQLNGDLSRYALVVCNRNINWFYARNPEWTKKNLLCYMNSSDIETVAAFWSGFLWGAKILPSPELYKEIKPDLLEYAKNIESLKNEYSIVLCGLLLLGWADGDVLDNEFRGVLIECDENFRSLIMWDLRNRITTDDKDDWVDLTKRLFSNVWPKQLSAISSKVTENICELIFSDKRVFEEVGELILPFVDNLKHKSNNLHIQNLEYNISGNPDMALTILYKVLPNDVDIWPYSIKDFFDAIEHADENLNNDERLIELKRKKASQ